MCATMIRRTIVTLTAVKFPEARERLSVLMCHSLVTANKSYLLAIKDQQVCSIHCLHNRYANYRMLD